MTQPSFSHLLATIRLGPVTVRNRLVTTAHGTSMAQESRPSAQLIAYHAARAKGGIGLIITEAVTVHRSCYPGPRFLVGWEERDLSGFSRLADAVRTPGATVFAQLIHSGRHSRTQVTGMAAWSASAIADSAGAPCHAMSIGEIQEIYAAFARTALNMQRAGMQGVEIHGAHGYLVTQFLSGLTNRRIDSYGGTLENRARFALELSGAIRAAVGRDFAVGMRLSAEEGVSGGITIEETAAVARWLEAAGTLDFLDISQGTQGPGIVTPEMIPDMSWGQAHFAHFAERIKRETHGIPVFTAGRIVDPVVAERILALGQADMVCMTRAHIADPEIGRKLIEGRDAEVRPCIGCNQGCIGRVAQGKPVGCTVNAEAGREFELEPIAPAVRPKNVLVVGGGVGGMEAARVAAIAGHHVTLYERAARLGGQVNTLVKAPYRQDFGKITAWLERQLAHLKVNVQLGVEVNAARLQSEAPDVVILATGSVPTLSHIPGASVDGRPHVVSAAQVLDEGLAGSKVVVLDADGHHKALNTAEFLADAGYETHLVTNAADFGGGLVPWSRTAVIERLTRKGVVLHPNSYIKEVVDSAVKIQTMNAVRSVEEVDLIVIAGPGSSSKELADAIAMSDLPAQVFEVGDCNIPGQGLDAIWQANQVARSLS